MDEVITDLRVTANAALAVAAELRGRADDIEATVAWVMEVFPPLSRVAPLTS